MKFVLWNIINYQHVLFAFVVVVVIIIIIIVVIIIIILIIIIIIKVSLQEYKEYSKMQKCVGGTTQYLRHLL